MQNDTKKCLYSNKSPKINLTKSVTKMYLSSMKNYEILKEIGRGAFATVYTARDAAGNVVVIKRYTAASEREARREYRFLQVFRSASIIAPIAWDAPSRQLVLPYIQGEHPSPELLNSPQKRAAFLAQVAAALAHMHSVGVCYNDLKPANCILHNAQPVLIDLGLATPFFYQDAHFRGTPAFAAPEKVLYATNSPAADCFALGLMALWLQTGSTPADAMPFDEYKTLLSNAAAWQEYVNQTTEDTVIHALLEHAPQQRPAMAEAARRFAQRAGISLPHLADDVLAGHLFSSQHNAVKQLMKRGSLRCSLADEPEVLARQALLWMESAESKAVILQESSYLWHPQQFFAALHPAVHNEAELQQQVENSGMTFLLWRDLPHNHTRLFDDLQGLKAAYVLQVDLVTSHLKAEPHELHELAAMLSVVAESAARELSPRAARTWLQTQLHDGLCEMDEELLQLLAALAVPLSLELIDLLWPDSSVLIQAAAKHPQVQLRDDGLVFVGEAAAEADSALLQRLFDAARQHGFLQIALRCAVLLQQPEQALQVLTEFVDYLVKREWYASAYEVLTLVGDELDLPVSLQRRRAFLLRKSGHLQQALDAYEAIDTAPQSADFAVIASDRAVILQELGRVDDALLVYQSLVPVFEQLTDTTSQLRTLNNIGVIHVQQHAYGKADQAFNTLLNSAKAAEKKQFVTMAHLNLADVYLAQGQWRKALYQAQTAAELGRRYRKKNIEVWATIYGIQAQWALGGAEVVPQAISAMARQADLQENRQLYELFAALMLPILHDVNHEKIEELSLVAMASQQGDETLLMMRLWHSLLSGSLQDAVAEASRLQHTESAELAQAIVRGDAQLMSDALQTLARNDDVLRYCIAAVCLLQVPWFAQAEMLRQDITRFAALHPFAPLDATLHHTGGPQQPAHLSLLWRVINLIHTNEAFDTTMQAILSGVIQVAQLQRSIYFRFDDGELVPRLGFDRDLQPLNLQTVRISTTILQETIKLGHIRFFENLQEDTPFDIHSSIFGLGLRTAVCYPIIVNSEIKGVIYADATSEREFSDEDRNLLEALFAQSRAALEKNSRIEVLTRERDRIQQAAVDAFPEIIGVSGAMQKIFTLMKTVGSHNVNVLITGPTGSGKELIARALHREYNDTAAFVAVNCAAIPEHLLESELFGYVKGAFTGAATNRQGKIEAANGGTLFLDEIGDMPHSLQAKLLRVLQERLITPLGSNKEIPVSFRVIAATNTDLQALVETGQFRQDLFYRLNVVAIAIPPLSERPDDILPLAEYFMQKYNRKFGKSITQLAPQAVRSLLKQPWKGNVRELENAMEKSVLMAQGDQLTGEELADVPDDVLAYKNQQLPLQWTEYRGYRKRIVTQLDKRFVHQLLKVHAGNVHQASREAGIPRPQIYRILKEE